MSGGDRAPEAYTDEQRLDFYVRSSAFFGERVREVGDEEWTLPTPCEGWDVRTVVAHVVIGDAQVSTLVEGGQVERVEEFNPTILGPNPLSTWRGTALGAIRAISAPGALEQRYAHPIGNVRGRTIVGFRITDSLVHGWDLARAVGDEVLLDPEICEYCLDFWFPMAATLPDSGYYAPAVMPPDDADPATRLLALLGRRTAG
jgi:uncharacterized protein (TIGR03086 family)